MIPLSCPFCGRAKIFALVVPMREGSFSPKPHRAARAFCRGCSTLGPIATFLPAGDVATADEAASAAFEAWNKRHIPTEAP